MFIRKLPLIAAVTLATPALSDTYTVEIWADNWFAFSVNGQEVAQDSTPYNTERSFNADRFSFDATPPFVIGIEARDFKENDTGLEYIGTRRQQMGDGGVIMQMSTGGQVVATSGPQMACLVTHDAPAAPSCADESNPVAGQGACAFSEIAAPSGWSSPGFDASGWAPAVTYSEAQVRPKDGYDQIRWSSDAELIWGPDLETNNTVLCRLEIE